MVNVLVVEDDKNLREAVCDSLEVTGYTARAAASGSEAIALVKKHSVDIVLTDIQMEPMDGMEVLKSIRNICPDIPVILMTAYGSIQQAVDTMKLGAMDYLVKPFTETSLLNVLKEYTGSETASGAFVAEDEQTIKVQRLARKIARSNATVMLTGESGVGKEVMARYIHDNSARKGSPFVAINCAAIPDNMLEATLFGYEKGAFTGAYQSRAGKFEQADGGTLLLDEITEMDLSLQAKILRVIQEKEVERIGGKNLIKLDVRIIATSNRNLGEEVEQGRFREDLYYRLNVFPIRIPALRERRGDILPIARSMLERISTEEGAAPKRISPQAEKKLQQYGWPGNVRELDNIIQRAWLLSCNAVIDGGDIDLEPAPGSEMHVADNDRTNETEEKTDLKKEQFRIIASVLQEVEGNRKKAAQRLGMSERTLRYKIAQMKDYGMHV